MTHTTPTTPGSRRRSFRAAVTAAVTLLVLAAPARAQQAPGASAPKGPATEARLNQRLAALKAERTEVEATNRAAREAAAKAEAALAARRDELARELVAARLEERRLRVEASALEAEARSSARTVKALERGRRRVIDATRGFIEQLRVLLAEMPAEEVRRERLAELDRQLTGGDAETTAEAFDEVLTIHAELARAGRAVTIREVELWTAQERKERVRLLAAGFVAFAYKTTEGRIGLAVGAPSDARGFRWTEDLPERERAALAQAFGEGGRRPVPIDALGRVRVEALEREEDLRTRLEAGGFVMIPLAGVALLALLVALERALMLFLAGFGRRIGDAVLGAVDAGRLDEARALCARRGLVPGVLSAALSHAEHSPKVMEDAVQERLLHDHPSLQKRLGGLAVLGAIAPLLGLLGTVTGIIQTFAVIKTYGSADPGLMAGGISEALITTASGLVVAIPILLAHSLLSGRVDALLADAERQAASLLNRLALRHHEQRAMDRAASKTAEAPSSPEAKSPKPGVETKSETETSPEATSETSPEAAPETEADRGETGAGSSEGAPRDEADSGRSRPARAGSGAE